MIRKIFTNILLVTIILSICGCSNPNDANIKDSSSSAIPQSSSSIESSSSAISSSDSISSYVPKQKPDRSEISKFTSDYGWSLEVLPVDCDTISFEFYASGPFRILECEVFAVTKNGKTAIYSGDGEKLTDFVFNPADVSMEIWQITKKDDSQQDISIPKNKYEDWMEGGKLYQYYFNKNNYTLKNSEVEYFKSLGYTVAPDSWMDKTNFYYKDQIIYSSEKSKWCLIDGDTFIFDFSNKFLLRFNKSGEIVYKIDADGGRCTNYFTTYKRNDKWGMLDLDGQIILDCIYDSMEITYPNYDVILKKDGKYGLIDKDINPILPFEYEDIKFLDSSSKSFAVKKDGKYGVIPDITNKKQTIPFQYDEISIETLQTDSPVYTVKSGAEYYLVSADNKVLAGPSKNVLMKHPAFHDTIYFSLQESVYTTDRGDLYNNNGKLLHSNILFRGYNPASTDPIAFRTSDLGATAGYMNKNAEIIAEGFDHTEEFYNQDFAIAKKNGKICFVNKEGKIVLQTNMKDVKIYNPETMVFAMSYNDHEDQPFDYLVKVHKGK